MEAVLEQMLNGVLVIPFQKDFTLTLATLCKSYAETINRNKVEDCVSAFLCDETNTDLSTYITQKYREQFDETIKLPPVVYKILSQYVVYMLIVDVDESYENRNKMLYSLIVRNMMVVRKNSYNQLLAPTFITPLYPLSDSYREERNRISACSEIQIVPDIFDSDSFDDMDITPDETLFDEIKQLAQKAEKLKYQELINEIKTKDIKDPFVLAYYAANRFAVIPEWKYVDANPVRTLMDILPTNRKNSHLKDIKTKLNESELYANYSTKSKSSLLLNYINGSNTDDEIGELKFSDIEFAIYMYYEYFLEELIIN